MSVHVKELAFVFHPVSKIDRARAFYEGLLGLKAGVQMEFAPGLWWIEYELGNATLTVSNALGDPSAALVPSSSVTLEVADLDAALASLKAGGVEISQDILDFPPCRMFSAKDSDGNEIRFHQRKR